jgi:hypothetical protein
VYLTQEVSLYGSDCRGPKTKFHTRSPRVALPRLRSGSSRGIRRRSVGAMAGQAEDAEVYFSFCFRLRGPEVKNNRPLGEYLLWRLVFIILYTVFCLLCFIFWIPAFAGMTKLVTGIID